MILQALHDEGAVEAGEGHDVADGGKRDEVQEVAQIRCGAGFRTSRWRRRLTKGGDGGEEGHGGGAEAVQAAEASVQAVGVDGRQHGGWRALGDLWWSSTSDVRLSPATLASAWPGGGGAAIDADDEGGAAGRRGLRRAGALGP